MRRSAGGKRRRVGSLLECKSGERKRRFKSQSLKIRRVFLRESVLLELRGVYANCARRVMFMEVALVLRMDVEREQKERCEERGGRHASHELCH